MFQEIQHKYKPNATLYKIAGTAKHINRNKKIPVKYKINTNRISNTYLQYFHVFALFI